MGILPGSNNEGGERIVRQWLNHSAPTGEAERLETDAGRVWKPHLGFLEANGSNTATGVTLGRRIGDRIYPER